MESIKPATFTECWESLPTLTKIAVKIGMFVGSIGIMYYLGLLSLKGLGFACAVCLACGMFIFACANTEHKTREKVENFIALCWGLIATATAEAMKTKEKEEEKVA